MRVCIFALLVLTACGSGAEGPSSSEVVPGYSVHEWGFIGHHFADDSPSASFVGAGPGSFQRLPSIGLGRAADLGRGGGKPILYVHLDEGLNQQRLRVMVTLGAGGTFPEHLPRGDLRANALGWSVTARRGSCSARERYPCADDSACSEPDDGYCEAAELAAYETDDAACLRVGDADWNHLFYRARAPGQMPIRVTSAVGARAVRNEGSTPLPSKMIRIRRHARSAETRVNVFDAPAPGAELTLPEATTAAAEVASATLREALGDLGMTASETAAFMTAWEAELLGASNAPEERPVVQVGTPPAALRPTPDALVYFLPRDAADALIRLTFEPAPRAVHRAILVRIDLSPRHYGTLGLGAPSRGTVEAGGQDTGGTITLRRLAEGGTSSFGRRRGRWRRSRFGTIRVSGSLHREVVRRVIRTRAAMIERCHQEAGEERGGPLTLRLDIAPDGSVTMARVDEHSLPAALGECVARVGRGYVFPRPPDGGGVTAEQPILFSMPRTAPSQPAAP